MQSAHKQRSYLFTLHLWQERSGRKEHAIRFKVQHVLSGEVRYFREWPDVLAFVMSIVEKKVNDTLNPID